MINKFVSFILTIVVVTPISSLAVVRFDTCVCKYDKAHGFIKIVGLDIDGFVEDQKIG